MRAKRIIQTAVMILAAAGMNCVYTDVKAPGPVTYITSYRLTTDDFQILGRVEASGEIVTILGLVQFGGNGYAELFQKAKALGGDDIIKYTFNLESWSLLTLVYNKAVWRASATVIKYRDKAIK